MEEQIQEWKDSRCVKIVGGKAPNCRWQCVHCDRQFTGGGRKFFNHILGITKDKSAQIAPCVSSAIDPAVMTFCTEKTEDTARLKRQRQEADAEFRRVRTLREEEVRKAREAGDYVEEEVSNRGSTGSSTGRSKRQCGLPETLQKQSKLSVDEAVAGMMYETGLPFRWAAAPSVREMFNEVCLYAVRTGKTFYRPPGRDRLREDLLLSKVKSLEADLDALRVSQIQFGSTLVTDGKDDAAKEHAENFCLVSPAGWQWLKSVDTSSAVRDSKHVADSICKEVTEAEEKIRASIDGCDRQLDKYARDTPHFVVHAVTDTPSANAAAWPLIEEQMDWMTADPCTLHGASLHFKHATLGDSLATPPLAPLAMIGEVNPRAKVLEQFFSNKSAPKSLLKAETQKPDRFGPGGLRVRKFSDTRMGNMYRVWHRLQRLEQSLKTVIQSAQYRERVKETGVSELALANVAVREIIEDPDFWRTINELVMVFGPAYSLLRMVDGVRPTAGKFYYYAQQLQNHYDVMAEKYPWASHLQDLWRADWDYIHCAFHSAGFACDPEFAGLEKPGEVTAQVILGQ